MINGDIYQHYKGNKYVFLYLAKHTETEENLIIYKSLDGDCIWAMPYKMFYGKVDINGEKISRFKLIESV